MQKNATMSNTARLLKQLDSEEIWSNFAARFDDFNKPPELIQFAIAVKSLHTQASNICIE